MRKLRHRKLTQGDLARKRWCRSLNPDNLILASILLTTTREKLPPLSFPGLIHSPLPQVARKKNSSFLIEQYSCQGRIPSCIWSHSSGRTKVRWGRELGGRKAQGLEWSLYSLPLTNTFPERISIEEKGGELKNCRTCPTDCPSLESGPLQDWSQGLCGLHAKDGLWFLDPGRRGQYASGIKSEPVTQPTQGPEVQ